MESAGERLFGILIYLSTSGPIGSGAPGAPNPGGPRVPGVSSSPEGLRENLRFYVCHQFATRHFFALLTIDSINKFARNTTNNTSISLKIIPGASSGLWLSITMHYTSLRYPDPESLPVRSSAGLRAVRLAAVAMLDDVY